MAYKGLIAPVVNIRNHPNASKVALGTCSGYQVVVGLNTKERTLGIFFGTDGQLTPDMLSKNNLYRHSEKNTDQSKSGYFEDNGRVRVQKFRGENSEGFWMPLDNLAWTGTDITKMKEGDEVDVVNGFRICEKYYTKATLRAMKLGKEKDNKKKSKAPSLSKQFDTFKEHYSVNKLRNAIGTIPNDQRAIVYISEKVHGTSGRTGRLLQRRKANRLQRFFGFKPREEYKYISGTRRVILDPQKTEENGFYSGRAFRSIIHNAIAACGLHKGETLYYEIVGYDDKGGFIMPPHGVEDKKLKKKYGSKMAYTYGCVEGSHGLGRLFNVLVYRITVTSLDGHVTELPWAQVETRCKELGVCTVPVLQGPFILKNREDLFEVCGSLADGPSTLDDGHIREGVCVRIEHPDKNLAYKYKGYHFADLEGIAKNSDTYVDPEEIA